MAQQVEWKQFIDHCQKNDWNFVVWFAGKQHLIRSREEADRRFPNKNTRGLCRWVAQQKGLWQHGNVPKSLVNVISSYSRGAIFTPQRCMFTLRKLLNTFFEGKDVIISTNYGRREYKKPQQNETLKLVLHNEGNDHMYAEYHSIRILTSDAMSMTLKSWSGEGDAHLNTGLARFCGSRLKSIEVIFEVSGTKHFGEFIQIMFKHIPQFSGTYTYKSTWPTGYFRTFSWADLTS